LEELFIRTLKLLRKAGAKMVVMEGELEHLEFSKISSSKENIEQLFGQLSAALDGDSAYAAIEKMKK